MALTKELPAEAYTFDDVLLKPGLSDVMPSEVDVRSRLTRGIPLREMEVEHRADDVGDNFFDGTVTLLESSLCQ